jgi:hypothetical protein
VPKHDRQARAEACSSKLHAADLRRRDDIPSYSNDEQITKPLPENEFRRNSRVGTSQDNGKRLLGMGEQRPTALTEGSRGVMNAGNEGTVALSQSRECFLA